MSAAGVRRGEGFEPVDAGNMSILIGEDDGYYDPIEWRSCDETPSIPCDPFPLDGLAILADAQYEPDDWDSSYFYLLGRLPDGRYVTCEAWNDSTGWGCQDGRTWTVASSLERAVVYGLSQEARNALGIPHDGVAALAWERELAEQSAGVDPAERASSSDESRPG